MLSECQGAAGNSFKYDLSLCVVTLGFSAVSVCKSKVLALPLIEYALFVLICHRSWEQPCRISQCNDSAY